VTGDSRISALRRFTEQRFGAGRNFAPSGDLVLALIVFAIAAMLLVPLPTQLLDVLIVLNISFAILLLLAGLYMPNALALLAFPSLLLLTTLFRLSLNVASTRLILSQGDAGRVIEAFGTFLIRGEVAVGLIIFTIITIVNFIVIARGASRVSEVAARFALDALPGKQMAIDADLRAGLLSAEEAGQRRAELGKESQLYGAMDGSMKFVQGDAIAGLFIIVTNIVGGIYLGVRQGMPIAEAVQTYTTLTVGDGLVSQIPALLISICAGMVVTRIASRDNATLGSDLAEQLFSQPATFLLTGLLLLGIALIPGLPTIPFFAVGAIFLACYIWLRHRARYPIGSSEVGRDLALPFYPPVFGAVRNRLPGSNQQLLATSQSRSDEQITDETIGLSVALDREELFQMYRSESQRYHFWFRDVQRDFHERFGVSLPELRFIASDQLASGEYELTLNSIVIERGLVATDRLLVDLHPEVGEVLGLEVAQPTRHPLSGAIVGWSQRTAVLRRLLDAAQITAHDSLEYIVLRAVEFCRRNPQELLSITNVHAAIKQLEKRHPGLIGESLNRSFMTLPRLTEVCQELVRQGLSVRDFPNVLEGIATYCSSFGGGLGEEDQFDRSDIVNFVRSLRRRQICGRIVDARNCARVMTLSHSVEELFERQLGTGQGSSRHGDAGAAISSSSELQALQRSLRSLMAPVFEKGVPPVSFLCRPELRSFMHSFVRASEIHAEVLSYDEIEPGLVLDIAGQLGGGFN